MCTCHAYAHLQATPQACRVAPMEGGLSRACFRPEKAGPYSLTVKLEPGSTKAKSTKPTTLNMTLTCIAGAMDISKCKIERKDTSIVAGRTGSLTISCCDIFGNPTCNVPVVPLTLVPSGALRVWWARPPKSSTLTLSYSSRESGPCTLGIAAPKGGASIQSSPVEIDVRPDGPCAAQCTATPRCGRRIITPETATLTAGTYPSDGVRGTSSVGSSRSAVMLLYVCRLACMDFWRITLSQIASHGARFAS